MLIFAPLLILLSSCRATRVLSTEASQVYAGDTIKTSTIVTESYEGVKRN